jgi:hypothetical protein
MKQDLIIVNMLPVIERSVKNEEKLNLLRQC